MNRTESLTVNFSVWLVMLRDYQQKAVSAAVTHLKKSTDSIILELPTGAGKSHIIAAIARDIFEMSNKRIICLAPSAELVKQNFEKYLATGNQASIFSASAGSKCFKYPVIFGTPMSILNSIDVFLDNVSLIVLDEAHRITNTVKKIIHEIRDQNSMLRVVGTTATPYRMNTGYIYLNYIDQSGSEQTRTIEEARDPYFHRLIYSIDARYLIDRGYLTQPIADKQAIEYDTSKLEIDKKGKFTAESVDMAFVGKGRLTSAIIADIVKQSRHRKGVLIFCATVAHAKEALESMPQDISAMITGATKKEDRDRILQEFLKQKIKYLVNVSVLTTGFDAPHIDVVAVLRATESASLFQQIIGRGLRLYENKEDALILDYAGNIDRHFENGSRDIFDPVIAAIPEPSGYKIEVECPVCGCVNCFAVNLENKDFPSNRYGYTIDSMGAVLDDVKVHHGRRCGGRVFVKESLERCGHWWNSKECPECGTQNDIAAHYCSNKSCKAELIDPNEKLHLAFTQFKNTPTIAQCDEIRVISANLKLSKAGNEMLVINVVTDYRKFTAYLVPAVKWKWKSLFYDMSIDEADEYINFGNLKTVSYIKKGDFYNILGFNDEADTY